jgi:hypothetical protein
MPRATTARQLALQAARNGRNSTARAASAASPLADPPRPTLPAQPLITRSKAINNSIKALNRRLLQDQIDFNAAAATRAATLADQTLQFIATAEERRILE